MVSSRSSVTAQRVRKQPEERRAEIVAEAARIALSEGLERITLREVAERLGVRPGLIGHYFPAVGALVIEAFTLAISGERQAMFPGDGTALEQIARLVHRIEAREADDLARLWLNARHLSRFNEPLLTAIEEQEDLDRAELAALLRTGVETGEFATSDIDGACIRIFMAIDSFGCYVNDREPFAGEAFHHFVSDVVVWSLGLEHAQLATAVARVSGAHGQKPRPARE